MTDAMTLIRQTYPRLRRTEPTAIIHSGGRQTVYGCVCGSRHTVATRNRGTTRHEGEWIAAHRGCAEKLAARILAGERPAIR